MLVNLSKVNLLFYVSGMGKKICPLKGHQQDEGGRRYHLFASSFVYIFYLVSAI